MPQPRMAGPQPQGGQPQRGPAPGPGGAEGPAGELQQLHSEFLQMDQAELADIAVQLVQRVMEMEAQMGGGAPGPGAGPAPRR